VQSLLAMSLSRAIILYMRSKCFIQRCKTVMLCNGSAFKFPTQFLRRNSRGNLSLHLNYYISWCYSVRLASIWPYSECPSHQVSEVVLQIANYARRAMATVTWRNILGITSSLTKIFTLTRRGMPTEFISTKSEQQ
jgi:hypothetical protein